MMLLSQAIQGKHHHPLHTRMMTYCIFLAKMVSSEVHKIRIGDMHRAPLKYHKLKKVKAKYVGGKLRRYGLLIRL